MWKMIIFYNLMSDKLASEDVLYTTENQRLCLISGGMCVWGGGGGEGGLRIQSVVPRGGKPRCWPSQSSRWKSRLCHL